MFKHETYRRVTYGETDRMGYLYYGHYPEYYEVARVEGFRKLGIRYRDMEDVDQVILPVVHMEVHYKRPAKYDELVRIESIVEEMPNPDIHFKFSLYNEDDKLLNEATVTLAFASKLTGRRCPIPESLKSKLLPFFVQ